MKKTTLAILVVEDDPLFREQFEQILKNEFAGIQLTFANNGAEGLDCARRAVFDLIVTDLRMPMLTGLEMLVLLRQQHNHTPAIIASSSDLPPGDVSHAGAFLFLPKHELVLLPDFIHRLLGSTSST